MPSRNYAVTVGTTATLIWWYSPDRISASLFNNGAADIYVSPDAGVTTGIGYRVQPGGQYPPVGLVIADWNMPLWGISGTAGQDVRVTEQIKG